MKGQRAEWIRGTFSPLLTEMEGGAKMCIRDRAKGLCERIGIDGKFTYKPQVEGKQVLDAVDVAMPTHSCLLYTSG